jgi:hypothetical protein
MIETPLDRRTAAVAVVGVGVDVEKEIGERGSLCPVLRLSLRSQLKLHREAELITAPPLTS